MPKGCGSHAASVTFCHICHGQRGRVPSAQASVTLHGLSLYTHREYPDMAWKFNIGVFFYVVIIPYFLRLN